MVILYVFDFAAVAGIGGMTAGFASFLITFVYMIIWIRTSEWNKWIDTCLVTILLFIWCDITYHFHRKKGHINGHDNEKNPKSLLQ